MSTMTISKLKEVLDKFPDETLVKITVKLGDNDYFSTVDLTDYIFIVKKK